MNTTSSKLKKKLFSNGSPLIAVVLFIAAFLITSWLIRSCTMITVDRFALGADVRAIVDGEKGEIVLTIDGNEYYERDLKLMIQAMNISDPQYLRLGEEKVRMIAGTMLVKEKLLLLEYDRLGLSLSEDDFTRYIENEKKTASDLIRNGGAEADNFINYITGYGCSFSEYFEDGYVIESFRNSAKTDAVRKKLSEDKGRAEINDMDSESHIKLILEEEVYKITLFGEVYSYGGQKQ